MVGVDIALAEIQRRLGGVDTRGGYCALVSQTGTFVSHPDQSYIMAESVFSLAAWHESAELEAVGREMIAGKTGVRRLTDVDHRPAGLDRLRPGRIGPMVALGGHPGRRGDGRVDCPAEPSGGPAAGRAGRDRGGHRGGLDLGDAGRSGGWPRRPARSPKAISTSAWRDGRVSGRDEIGRFVGTFNQMVGDLKENVEVRVRETAARQAMERELQIAREIQTSLLPMARPPFPHRREFTLDAQTVPAKIMAGDFFDFWFVEDDVLALVMADVSGKGVPAALFMAVGRTVLRNFSVPGQSPAQVLSVANHVMAAQNEKNMFITVFYGHYHVRTGELVFANGGHPPPYLVRRDGTVLELDAPAGPLVGVLPDAEYGESRETLGPGELLVLYTDGATEARNQDGLLLGDDGLRQIIAEAGSQSGRGRLPAGAGAGQRLPQLVRSRRRDRAGPAAGGGRVEDGD